MPQSRTSKNGHLFFLLCGLLLIAAVLYWAQKVLIPVALAVLLSFVLTPCVSVLQRRGLGRVVSVVLVVTLALVLLGGIGWVISRQIASLAANLPNYQEEIVKKVQDLRGAGSHGFWGTIQGVIHSISEQTDYESGEQEKARKQSREREEAGEKPGESAANPMYMQIAPSGWSRALQAVGPAAEGLGDVFLVMVLVAFILTQRENLRNRFVRLIGDGRLIITTRAIDEAGRRISRYLLMQVFINTVFGATLTVGLFVAGLISGQKVLCQYAILWGFLAGSLRFVPYLGTWIAAALILGFTIATIPGWGMPLGLLVFYLVVEVLTANVVEPLVFGHSTGVSPLALLLAAAFWTWLWGPVGLILSTPLTVILAVLGKYVPQLEFLEVMLGDEPVLSTDVMFYQRLVARDLDEASEVIEDYLPDHPLEAVYEEVLLPALLLARKDRTRGESDPDDYQFVLQGIRDVLVDLASVQLPPTKKEEPAASTVPILGCPGRDEADELALDLFGQYLRLSGYSLEIVSAQKLSAEVLARIQRENPAVVCIGSLPPGGLAQARYLCKRIRQQCSTVKIAVGRWGDRENGDRMEKRLHAAGADHVATTFRESRAQIIPLIQAAAINTPSPDANTAELVTSR